MQDKTRITLSLMAFVVLACSAGNKSSNLRRSPSAPGDQREDTVEETSVTAARPGADSAAGEQSQGDDLAQQTGNLKVTVGEELVTVIGDALVAHGLTQTQVDTISDHVRSQGVLAVETESALRLLADVTPLEVIVPDVAGAFVASLALAGANLPEALRTTAISVVTEAAMKFSGDKDLAAEARSTLLGSIAQSVVLNTKEAALSADAAIEAVGLVANVAFGGMIDAGIQTDKFNDTAQLISARIGESLGGLGLENHRIPDAFGVAAAKAGGALGRLPLTDAAAAVALTTEGFVNGMSASSKIPRDVKISTIAEIPKGVNSTVPNWLPSQALATALDRVTDATVTGFLSKLGPTTQEIVDKLPRIAEGSVAGLAMSTVAVATVASENLATRPLQSIMNRLESVVTDPSKRLDVVQNTLNKSISALGNASQANFATTVAPQIVNKTFEMATNAYQKFNVEAANPTQVTTFYDAMMKGAIDGVAGLGSKNQQSAAIAATSVLAETMDAAVQSLNTMYANPSLSISEEVLKSLPTRAAQNLGERLAKVLPPDDLNSAFATVTSQYIYNIQSVAATKATSVDVGELANKISADSLATFSTAWNARPTDMQTAVTALNNRLGTMAGGIDAKVIASVQGGTQTVVVQASGGMARLDACPPTGTLTLAVCTKPATGTCPSSPDAALTPGYSLVWKPDATNERCFMYREITVQTTQSVLSCDTNSEYVYGIGCRAKLKTCAPDETFVYGIGCQSVAYFCPAGQKFTASQGCVVDSFDRFNCEEGQRWTIDG